MPTGPGDPGGDAGGDAGRGRVIPWVATSITAFVGRALRGPVGEPVPVRSFTGFVRSFGELWRESTLSYAVRHFFSNGGTEALVVRAFDNDPTDVGGVAPDDFSGFVTTFTLPGDQDPLTLEAANPGAWADDLVIFVDPATRDPDDASRFDLTVHRLEDGIVRATERFRDLAIGDRDPRFVGRVLAEQSDLVRVRGAVPARAPRASPTVLGGHREPATISSRGDDGGAIGFENVAEAGLAGPGLGIYALDDADLFNLLSIPPFEHETDVDVETWTNALSYCRENRAMLIVDPPAAWAAPGDVRDAATGVDGARPLVPSRDENAVVYFPRLRMPDPLQGNRLETFAPGGAVAGVFARTDAERGVWKAPAGQEATLTGVRGLACRMTDDQCGRLNSLAVNCLRTFPGAGSVVWGARTLDGADHTASEWKYVPMRRLALFIEESVSRGTGWVAFEPNDESLRAEIRLAVDRFMLDLFRRGAFQGSSPREAYFVRCDSETTTPSEIEEGIVTLLVGFAPLRPAEFVTLRIRQPTRDVPS